MIKTLRDAEIQIEALRDEIRRLKQNTPESVTENWVKSAISKAIKSIRIPEWIQSNIFEEILIRRKVSGLKQPNITIESLGTDNTKSRITKLTDNSRLDLTVNMQYDGVNYTQDDTGLTSLKFTLRANAADAAQAFYFDRTTAGDTAPDRLLTLEGDGHLHPGANSSFDCGITGLRWRTVYADDLTLTNPLSVVNGGTGRNTLTTDYTLQGNGTGQVKMVAGIDLTPAFVISLNVSTTDLNYKDHGGANQTTTVVTGVTVNTDQITFTKGILTGS